MIDSMNSHYKQTLIKVEEILQTVLPSNATNSWGDRVSGCEDPSVLPSYYDKINAPALDLINRGGKRWRPVLMSFCCELCGGGNAALPYTPLVELPHNGSLIVDDIEDSSDLRRGKPAVHLIYGEDMAINTGNMLYFLPLYLLDESDLDAEKKLNLHSIYAKALRRLHFGQGLDIQWHGDPDAFPSKDAYFRMCRHKTGSLAWMAGQAGAAVAGASEDERNRLGSLLEDLGVAFQILDDVKNLTAGLPGKDRGDDIVEGKKSLPVILFGQAHPERRGELTSLFEEARRLGITEGGVAIEKAITLLSDAGAIQDAREEAEEMIRRVRATLESSYPATPARESIQDMLDIFLS